LAGALLHVMNHGMFKALLFFGAGSVLHATGTREMSRLGGLWRVMPWTTALFGVGCLAVAGLPPLNGFVSEWLIYLGLFDLASRRDLPFGAAIPAILLLATAGAMALACFVKAAGIVFLGAPRTKAATRAHECGSWMRGAMLVLAAGCLLAGLVPGLLLPMLSRATGSWNPAWATWGEAAAPLGQLGSVQLMVAGLGAWGASELWRRANANGLRRGPTWDCGYSGPTPRMQYTSGSFAGIVSGWFRWILRPETVLRRPHGLLPGEAHGRERVPETVLEGVVRPAARWVMRVSTATRRLQHGRLSIYILYVVVGLVALGLLVVLGEHS
jgi:hydrogenase-4 component B